MEKIDISVIIPVYNACSTIIESIESVVEELANTKYQWEVIVIDDGSIDNSVQIVDSFIKESSYKNRITFIKQTNKGAAAARNTGINISKGEFIAFNDADDRWLKNRINYQIAYLKEHSQIDMIGCRYGYDKMVPFSHKKDIEYKITIKQEIFKCYFALQALLIRHNILERIGLFDESMRTGAEEGFLFNKLVYYGNCIFIDRKVAEAINAKKRWGKSGLSGNIFKMEKGELYNINQAYNKQFINKLTYIIAINFSILKFFRRFVITYLFRVWIRK